MLLTTLPSRRAAEAAWELAVLDDEESLWPLLEVGNTNSYVRSKNTVVLKRIIDLLPRVAARKQTFDKQQRLLLRQLLYVGAPAFPALSLDLKARTASTVLGVLARSESVSEAPS